VFLALAIGYWVGAIKLGSFSLGAVTGTRLAGVLIGQLDISVSDQVKTVFFLMFMFVVGYGVGPQFVRGIAHVVEPHAEEVLDRELEDVPVESVHVFVQQKAVNGKTLMEPAKQDFARGVFLTRITRGATSVEIPILAETKLYRGDILKITGTKVHTDRLNEYDYAAIGTAVRRLLDDYYPEYQRQKGS
jgi:uncharacterized transporter YbjL